MAALAGCGGRSSTLSPEGAIGADQPSGGSTAGPPSAGGSGAQTSGGSGAPANGGKAGAPSGGSSSGGSPSGGSSSGGGSPSGGVAGVGVGGTATGGVGTAGSAGAGGSSGLDPAVAASCINYCNASTRPPCPSGLSVPECAAACSSELSQQNFRCQKVGGGLLECLTAVYNNSKSCTDVDQWAFAKCSTLFARYQDCLGPDVNPPPPPPPPPPLPPPPPPVPLTCSTSGSSSNGKCTLDVKCTGGAYYNVSCYQTSPDQSSCSCSASLPDGSGSGASFGLNENATFACYDSLAACGFPQVGAQ